MATLTARSIPEDAKHRFRQVAAAHGRSMEEHLRQLIVDAGHAALAPGGGVREPPQTFGQPVADSRADSRARIERLIELGRGIGWEPEPRIVGEIRDINFE